MPKGFGNTQSKRRSRKPVEQKTSKQHEISLETDWQVTLENQASAWYAGVYNPLAELEPNRARAIEADEEEWLFLARNIGWLQVDDELNAIYFTAPPPAFDEKLADWYLRPDLATFIEEPVLLKEAIANYPIPHNLVNEAIAERTKHLKWNLEKTAAFIQKVTEKPGTELTNEDYTAVLLELQHLI